MQYIYNNLSLELLSVFVILQSFVVSYLVVPRIIAIVKIKSYGSWRFYCEC